MQHVLSSNTGPMVGQCALYMYNIYHMVSQSWLNLETIYKCNKVSKQMQYFSRLKRKKNAPTMIKNIHEFQVRKCFTCNQNMFRGKMCIHINKIKLPVSKMQYCENFFAHHRTLQKLQRSGSQVKHSLNKKSLIYDLSFLNSVCLRQVSRPPTCLCTLINKQLIIL